GQNGARLVLILGGEGKGQDFAPLQRLAPQLRAVIVIGRDGARIGQLFNGLVPVLKAMTMTEVVAIAANAAEAGDMVLLSPACASQDQYRDYQQRGDIFVRAVMSCADEVKG
ncbi:MAG: UDP-N-acetylmuramoyl-L-alanine--D-glutamate ligase, partial [Gammaproteobacteria bacterium]